jgi:hypothetical protein
VSGHVFTDVLLPGGRLQRGCVRRRLHGWSHHGPGVDRHAGEEAFVRRVLARFHTLGLTGPGQVLEGMPADFSILPEDMPDEPEDTEAGQDLPEEVLRQLCARLDELEAMITSRRGSPLNC